jgi:hypothetical protein
MTARQRTICHSAYIFFFVALSAYILQDCLAHNIEGKESVIQLTAVREPERPYRVSGLVHGVHL